MGTSNSRVGGGDVITSPRRFMVMLGVAGFTVAMTVRHDVSSSYARFLLLVLAAACQYTACLYASRRHTVARTVGNSAMMVLGVAGFAVAMTARDGLSSIHTRALLGGVAGVFMGLGMFYMFQQPKRQ